MAADATILLKSDHPTITLSAEKDGKVRVACSSWDTPAVLLPNEILEARWQHGQVVLLRRRVAADAAARGMTHTGQTAR